jgi:hypothetical protein
MIKYIQTKLSKIDIQQNILLFIVFIIIAILSLSFFIGIQWSKFRISLVEQRLSGLVERNIAIEFDRQRLADVQNILLALQDYKFDYKSFPEKLSVLQQLGYLKASDSLKDPSTGVPYYYLNRGDDFVFCVWLSDSIKGVNQGSCPLSQ